MHTAHHIERLANERLPMTMHAKLSAFSIIELLLKRLHSFVHNIHSATALCAR